jgi:phosphate transport system permease protein
LNSRSPALPPIWWQSKDSWRLNADRWLLWVARSGAAVAVLLVVLVCGFLYRESVPVFEAVGLTRFFADTGWHPAEQRFNMAGMVMGTLYTTLGAVILAIPFGILSAAFCHYYAPPQLAAIYRRLIELLAGIPSVVYGLWGLVALVPLIAHWQAPGSSLLAGIAVLFLMIVPTIALLTDACFGSVPRAYLQAAAALGLSRWSTLTRVVLPAARAGLIAAVMLASGRALGETMALLMVCGNVPQIPRSLFDPVRTLTANIALEMAYAMDVHRAALFASGLLLMVITLGLAWSGSRGRA